MQRVYGLVLGICEERVQRLLHSDSLVLGQSRAHQPNGLGQDRLFPHSFDDFVVRDEDARRDNAFELLYRFTHITIPSESTEALHPREVAARGHRLLFPRSLDDQRVDVEVGGHVIHQLKGLFLVLRLIPHSRPPLIVPYLATHTLA